MVYSSGVQVLLWDGVNGLSTYLINHLTPPCNARSAQVSIAQPVRLCERSRNLAQERSLYDMPRRCG